MKYFVFCANKLNLYISDYFSVVTVYFYKVSKKQCRGFIFF